MGAAAVGTTISVYAIARLMMNLPAGILADRYGRKPLLVWGPLITAIGACYLNLSPQKVMGAEACVPNASAVSMERCGCIERGLHLLP